MTERIESVKAGITAAVVFGLAETGMIFAHSYLGFQVNPLFSVSQAYVSQNSLVLELIGHIVVAVVSGFLFGVTYRYVIRGDRNPHLQDGAVLAFGLVRGLAVIEGTEFTPWWGLVLLESVVCFAVARLTLDIALRLKLLKPFI